MFDPDHSTTNQKLAEGIAERIQTNKPLMLAALSQEFGVTEYEAALALPDGMCRLAPADAFDTVWAELTTWERATFIMQHLGTVLEIKGTIPAGTHGHGYFNLAEGSIGGHLKVDDLLAVGFCSLPFMGLESHSVQFFNKEGAVKFSVYAGRENRKLIASVVESFTRLREAVCTK